MKKNYFVASLVLALGVIGLAGCTTQKEAEYIVEKSDMIDIHSLIGISTGTLTETEKAGLIKMREEEKLARDIYTTLGIRRGYKIFNNIALSENTHTNSIKELLKIYNIEDPVKNDDIGAFTSKEMAILYNQLLEQGNKSLMDALTVGATVEDLDIKDLNELINNTTNQNIIAVYNNLNRGSRNHMRAFVKNITKENGSYTPKYISNDEYSNIISASQETGMGRTKN